jgi:hypothetical protein
MAAATSTRSTSMLDKILPAKIDNAYRGYKVALWLFGLVLAFKTVISTNSIVLGRMVATRADGIPLATFAPQGAQAVVALFALWGLSQLFLCLLGVLVLVRYRAAVPLMYAVLFLEHLVRRLMLLVVPIVRVGTPPGLFVNIGLLLVMAVGLVLSVSRRAGLHEESGSTQ